MDRRFNVLDTLDTLDTLAVEEPHYAMELWSGIHSLDASRVSNVYLVAGPPLTLVDTGPPGALARLVQALDRAGVRAAAIERIVLTHCDVDHVGNARALQLVSGAEVCAHADDAPFITGARPAAGPFARRAIAATWGRNVIPPRIDRLLREGDDLAPLIVLHMPGHTPGHVGFRYGDALFSGDTVVGGRTLRPAPRPLTWDETLARGSIARIGTLDVDLLLPGHGTPVNDGARRCRELMAR